MTKLDQMVVAENAKYWANSIGTHQTAVYVMCGDGFIGKFAATQPGKFYLDDRVGRLPYSKRQIYQAVETLATIAAKNGLDPNCLGEQPNFHSCGIF